MSIHILEEREQKVKKELPRMSALARMSATPRPTKEPPPERADAPSTTGAGELSDKKGNGKERPWKKHKKESRRIWELMRRARELDATCITAERLDDMRRCADYLDFAVYADESKRLHAAFFCQVRLCPMCTWRRSLKMYHQVSQVIDAIAADEKAIVGTSRRRAVGGERKERASKPSRYLFLTLTIKNVTGDGLADAIGTLTKKFSMIAKNNRQRNAQGGTRGRYASRKSQLLAKIATTLRGTLRIIEVTYNKERRDYHPHIHALLQVAPEYFRHGNYLEHAEWRELWKILLGVEYEPFVNVQAIKGGTGKAIAEVAKYPVKLADVNGIETDEAADVLAHLSNALRGRRLITYTGAMKEMRRTLRLADVERGDLVNVGDDDGKLALAPVAYALYRWDVVAGAYIN